MNSKRDKFSIVYTDFEFNRISEPKVNLVSCVTHVITNGEMVTKKWWLHNCPNRQKKLAKYFKEHNLIFGHQCVAEARCFLALGLNPLEFNWIDSFLEYRMLTNHNDKLQWGEQLVKGIVKKVYKPKPKYERTEEDGRTSFRATHSLAEMTFKLTGEIRDTKEKDEVRQLIISDPPSFTPSQRDRILEYNAEDVTFLPTIWKRLKEEYKKLIIEEYEVNMAEYYTAVMKRGNYAAHTAIMEARGYPINVQATKNFSRQIPSILSECQRDVNSQFTIGKPFKWNKKDNRFSWNQGITKQWIRDQNLDAKWMKTDGGGISLALEAWERQFSFKHDYPRGNFGAQIIRYLKLKQSLNGFTQPEEGSEKRSFWDYVGSDGRVRPYMNIYGAQSSRSQPAATGFMFLKPAWMRSLVEPKPGRFCAGVDYGQEEFFLAALESGDQNMINAYLSGDPYLYGAKLAGVIPWDGTKEKYKVIRDIFKNTYLGILFGMTKWGLAIKLTNDTGEIWTEEEAQEEIDRFEDTFPTYVEHKYDQLQKYREGALIQLPCGWIVGPDNDNPRSVMNVPIQGRGATVMRESIDLAAKKAIEYIFTLHDADYMEDDVGNEEKVVDLMDCMRDAFQSIYKGTKLYEVAGKIKLDPFIWGPDYKRDSELIVKGIKIPCSDLYRDERALNEYDIFKKYFETPETDLL